MSGGDDKKERMTMVKLQELLNDKMDVIIESNNQENKKLNENIENIKKNQNELSASVSEMRKNIIDRLIEANKQLQEKVNNLEKKIEKLETSSEATNQYGRRNNVEISGIPNDINDSQLEDSVINIYKELDIDLVKDDIEACHRLPPPRKTPNAIKKVIVRFTNRKLAESAIKRKRIFNNGITHYFNYNLNRFYQKLAWQCRRLKNGSLINSYSYKNEAFYVTFNDQNGKEISKKIHSQNDLDELFPDFFAAVIDE